MARSPAFGDAQFWLGLLHLKSIGEDAAGLLRGIHDPGFAPMSVSTEKKQDCGLGILNSWPLRHVFVTRKLIPKF